MSNCRRAHEFCLLTPLPARHQDSRRGRGRIVGIFPASTRPNPPHGGPTLAPPAASRSCCLPRTHVPDPEAPIDTLTSKQRAHLRTLAHHLKPLLQVGADGVTEAVVDAVRDALNTRELLKVKVLESAPVDARAAADQLGRRIDRVQVPQVIGRTVVLYRPHPDNPEIRLPD